MWNFANPFRNRRISQVCMLFSDLPARKRPPFGGIRNPTSEPQWRFFLFGMSVHVIFCLNWWNLKGKDSVCKISFNFFFQPNESINYCDNCSAKMLLFFFVEVMMNWMMSCMVASPQPRSAKLRHWTPWTLHDMPRLWVVLNLQNLCLHFGVLDVEFSRRFWWVHFHPLSIIEISKMRKYWQFISKDKWSSKVFCFFFYIHRLSQWQQVGIAWRSLPMMLLLLRLDLDGSGHFKESWHVMTFSWNDCRYTIQYTTKSFAKLDSWKVKKPFRRIQARKCWLIIFSRC